MKLVWLDLETTGLSAHRDRILEVAVALSDLENPFAVEHVYQQVFYFAGGALDPFVQNMHTKNGLLAECAASEAILGHTEDALLKIIPQTADYADRPVLAGSTVHFDRDFVRHYWPRVDGLLHHRHYDVSAVKLFCQSLGMPKLPRAEAHRAKDDINESVQHAQLCARWLGKPPALMQLIKAFSRKEERFCSSCGQPVYHPDGCIHDSHNPQPLDAAGLVEGSLG